MTICWASCGGSARGWSFRRCSPAIPSRPDLAASPGREFPSSSTPRSSAWILLPGVASLVLFALCLTRVDAAYAGRAYAAYGGIYIASSLVWLRGVEGIAPDRWDLLGAGIAVLGALVVLLGPRP